MAIGAAFKSGQQLISVSRMAAAKEDKVRFIASKPAHE